MNITFSIDSSTYVVRQTGKAVAYDAAATWTFTGIDFTGLNLRLVGLVDQLYPSSSVAAFTSVTPEIDGTDAVATVNLSNNVIEQYLADAGIKLLVALWDVDNETYLARADVTVEAAPPQTGQTVTSVAGPFTQADADALYQTLEDAGTHANTSDAHHAKYTDAEAVSAMGVKGNANPLHHDRHTAAQIKADYEDHDDTNAYTDDEKSKVGNVPADTNTALAAKLGLTPGRTVFCFAGDDFATQLDLAVAITGTDTDNRATLLVEKGQYALSEDYTLTTDFVDIVCLTGEVGGIHLTGADFLMDGTDEESGPVHVLDGIDFTGTTSGHAPVLDNEPFVEFWRCNMGDYAAGDWDGLTNACDVKYGSIGKNFCRDGTQSGTVSNNGSIGDHFCYEGSQSGTVSNNGSIGMNFCRDGGENSGTVSNNGSIGNYFCRDGTQSGTVSNNGSIGMNFCHSGTQSGTVSYNGSIDFSFCYYGTQSGEVSNNGSIGSNFCFGGTQSGTCKFNTFADSQSELDGVLGEGGKCQLCIASDAVITELEYSA